MPRQASDDAQWQAAIADFRSGGLMQPSEVPSRRGRQPLPSFRRRRYPRPASRPTQAAAGPPTDAMTRLARRDSFPSPSSPSGPRPVPSAIPYPLILILDGRLGIAIAPGFDSETLSRLLDALEARP